MVYLFLISLSLCVYRSIYAVYESDVSVRGVPGFRFVPPSEVFANVTINPDNIGFCVTNDTCMGSGLLNVSVCKEGMCVRTRVCESKLVSLVILPSHFLVMSGAPIIMSSPHFYQADDKYVQDVYGMNPSKEEHETAIDINPVRSLMCVIIHVHIHL